MQNLQDDLSHGCNEGQGFALNYNPLYAGGGLLGHPGIDVNCGFASIIESYVRGLFYSGYFPEAPASDGYTGIFLLCETPLEVFEFAVGHVRSIDIPLGSMVNIGDRIGTEGNHGSVYAGNIQITLAMQKAGDTRGHHRHLQKRPCIKVKMTDGAHTYLRTANVAPYRDAEGNYYQIYAYNNGFNGCVDWTLPLFVNTLSVGMTSYEVLLLQRALVREGCGTFAPTGYFGPATKLALNAFQKKNGLDQAGVVGPKTRAILNAKYHPLF